MKFPHMNTILHNYVNDLTYIVADTWRWCHGHWSIVFMITGFADMYEGENDDDTADNPRMVVGNFSGKNLRGG